MTDLKTPANRPTVIVVGSLNADVVLRVPRLPCAGETVVGAALTTTQGGKGANQAAAAGRLGAVTWMVGRVGDDAAGRAAVRSLEDGGVDCSHVRVGAEPTGVAVVLVDDAGENAIAVASGANAEVDGGSVARAVAAAAAPGAVVLACLEVPLGAVTAAADTARARGCRFILNPAPAEPLDDELLALCDVLTPNRTELAILASGGPTQLLRRGAAAVVVTEGAEGAVLHRPRRAARRHPAFAVDVVDTTGAGDAFSATLAWALASGRDLDEAVRLACAGGALATRGLGARTSLPTAPEVERLAAGSTAGD